MAWSNQYAVGTVAVPVLASPAGLQAGPSGWFYLANGTAAIYLGSSGVTSSTGAAVAANGTLSGYLFPGDQVYAITASGSSVIGVLTTGA